MIWSYVKIAGVSSHIILHQKCMRRRPQKILGVSSPQPTQQAPLFSEQPNFCSYTPCCLSLHSVAICFFSPKMVGLNNLRSPHFGWFRHLVLCVLISCANTFVGHPIIPWFRPFPLILCWGRELRTFEGYWDCSANHLGRHWPCRTAEPQKTWNFWVVSCGVSLKLVMLVSLHLNWNRHAKTLSPHI